MGNSGARSSGPIGWPVPGCSGGCGRGGASARMSYQLGGISLSDRQNDQFVGHETHPFEEATGRQVYRGAGYKLHCAGTGLDQYLKERVHHPKSLRQSPLVVIFFMVIYFMMLFQVIVDIFRRHAHARGVRGRRRPLALKGAPLVGLLAYMITNSESMAPAQRGRREAVAGRVRQLRPERGGIRAAPPPRSPRPRSCWTAAPSTSRSSKKKGPSRPGAPLAGGAPWFPASAWRARSLHALRGSRSCDATPAPAAGAELDELRAGHGRPLVGHEPGCPRSRSPSVGT